MFGFFLSPQELKIKKHETNHQAQSIINIIRKDKIIKKKIDNRI
jgi:hypothetical protein